MPCYHPLKAWREARRNPTGKRGITFSPRSSNNVCISIPCGQCIGCRLERSRQWAVRCVHEAQLHERNCFVTLTYDDSNLPDGGTLVPRDFQLFMKRLRKSIGERRVRFFHCGEYGEELSRPHYHALLFGHDFSDRVGWSVSNGARLDRSAELERLWPFGFATVGDASFESAAYVARYVVKKVTGHAASEHYKGLHPEYVTMSRRPGIAANWFEQFRSDVYPSDDVVIRGGIHCKPPKFYDRLMERDDPGHFADIKRLRALASRGSDYDWVVHENLTGDSCSRRLTARGEVKEAQARILKRSLENDC